MQTAEYIYRASVEKTGACFNIGNIFAFTIGNYDLLLCLNLLIKINILRPY